MITLPFIGQRKKKLSYIIEDANWSVKWDGKYITNYLQDNNLIKSSIKYYQDLSKLKNEIVHFGERNQYLPRKYEALDHSNIHGFTWFHGTDDDVELVSALPNASEQASFVHTSNSLSLADLVRWGVDPNKIITIPIGVDTKHFVPISELKKQQLRSNLNIPQSAFVIGSFQKDGQGWGEGLEPKLIKGPDIFCDVIERAHEQYDNIFVLLTGPSRGYVKRRLEAKKIPYKHMFLKDYLDINKYYQVLDMYLVASRAEGGPKAIMESMATGIPLVSTKVGMGVDILEHNSNALTSEIDDVDSLVHNVRKIISDPLLASNITNKGLQTSRQLDWSIIAQQYYDKIYKQYM